ncbi:MAG: glucoamylase family protein [Armatimonadaceae bacterium]
MTFVSRRAALGMLSGAAASFAVPSLAAPPKATGANTRMIDVPDPKNPTPDQLWDTVQHRAFAFFWNETHPETGQTKDRAYSLLSAGADTHTVASIAATGYMFASLPIAVERKWIGKKEAEQRALTSLRYLRDDMENVMGFYYHFQDWATGKRVWNCELSSIDTGLLMLGALVAGQYFGGEVRTLADEIFSRVDWQWMTRGVPFGQPKEPSPRTLSMGWKPETGFIPARWQGYTEASYLYLLAMGAPRYPLPSSTWQNWGVEEAPEPHMGYRILGKPAPLFWAQMTPGYYDLRGKKGSMGLDWWMYFANAHKGNHAYCAANPKLYPKHTEPVWGITACDQPPAQTGQGHGYGAQEPVDGRNDGTTAPTAALAGILFMPEVATRTMMDYWEHYRDRLWGRYGFSNAFNVVKNWYDEDVIGIDLGMMILAIENHRSGLIWKLMHAHPVGKKGLTAAGFIR